MSDDIYDDAASPFDSPALQPTQAQTIAPVYVPQPSPGASMYAPQTSAPPRPEGLRSSLLKKPLDASMGEAPKAPILPSRFR